MGTSLFLNINWLLREGKMGETKCYYLNAFFLATGFLVIRVLTIPWAMWMYWSCPKSNWSLFERITSGILAPLVPLLNLYWFSFIARGVADKLGLASTKKKKQDTTKSS